ncbi:hypothetical protein G6F60_014504 [Rhizopus arrhizus]|nr:hypothetical protein G6F60_014504 [Rhizopus arrhizus]
MYAHYRQYLLWRRQQLDDFERLPGYLQAPAQDRADLGGGNAELVQEARAMRYNNATARLRTEEPYAAHHGMATPPRFQGTAVAGWPDPSDLGLAAGPAGARGSVSVWIRARLAGVVQAVRAGR